MGHGSPIWGAMRSLRRDQSVTDVRVAKGTAKRILRFAAPRRSRHDVRTTSSASTAAEDSASARVRARPTLAVVIVVPT